MKNVAAGTPVTRRPYRDGVKNLRLPRRSPDLIAYAERSNNQGILPGSNDSDRRDLSETGGQ
jgi:hypothetical protein